jgi:outer membrane protein
MIAVRIAVILTIAAVPLAAQSPVAGVDVGRAYRSYYKTVTTMEEIARQRATMEQDPRLDQLKDLSQQVREAEVTAGKLASGDQQAWLEARHMAELKREELRASARALEEARNTATKELNQELVTLSRKLLDDVQRIAAEIGRERGYELVVDSTGNTNTGIPLLLYSRQLPDLTEAVIARLNADAPTPETPAETAVANPDDKQAAGPPGGGETVGGKPQDKPRAGTDKPPAAPVAGKQ